MLTKLAIHNFKCFENVEVELGNTVVFIGPNNSGKTSAMHALTLWDTGLRHWCERRKKGISRAKRGITINRRDLLAVPHPRTNHLWYDLCVRKTSDAAKGPENVLIKIIVEGVNDNDGKPWQCGFEFYYANPETFYCRPLEESLDSTLFSSLESQMHISLLPPMSGLAAAETRLEQGAVNVRLGEGRTAEVLRNLCFDIHEKGENGKWPSLVKDIKELFGVEILRPCHVQTRGEITMEYKEQGSKSIFDLSASGRGLQQTLLILAFMYARSPDAVILLDEPDAHLEILRQRQIYNRIKKVAQENRSQIIAASHSEVILDESSDDTVIAFVGTPHKMEQQHQVRQALQDISFADYYLANEAKWVLYLEGGTDLRILQSFARRLKDNDADKALGLPFVKYIADRFSKAKRHFHGLREAIPDLKCVVLLDRPQQQHRPSSEEGLKALFWKKREIENYFCTRKTLEEYVSVTTRRDGLGGLILAARLKIMQQSIDEVEQAIKALNKKSPWGPDLKVSDEFLIPLFRRYFAGIGKPNTMGKGSFYELVDCIPLEEIDSEIKEKLNAIVEVARKEGDLQVQAPMPVRASFRV